MSDERTPAEIIADQQIHHTLELRTTGRARRLDERILEALDEAGYEIRKKATGPKVVDAERRWDIGDPEPGDVTEVFSVHFDDTDEYNSAVPLRFGRTYDGQWKTYLFGGKSYYDWDELVRRFGPVSEVQ